MSAQQRGVIRTWKDEKGFGFIAPDNGGAEVFFHVNEVVGRSIRPAEKMVVYFTLRRDERQRLQAVNVHLASEPLAPVVVSLLVVCAIFVALGCLAVVQLIPSWILLGYVAMSVLTYAVYGHDKTRAVTGGRRVAEKNLHLLELLGGWPGALVAQHYFRHKNRKASYQGMFWTMVLLNSVLLAVVALVSGDLLQRLS